LTSQRINIGHGFARVATLVGVLATFCAGAQSSTGAVKWGAGNGYPPGPYSSPNEACATVLNGLRGPAEGWGPNAYTLNTDAVANPAGWDNTPIGGYPYSSTYCNFTQTIYDCGTSCPHEMQITNGLPFVYAISPPATCPSATCPKDHDLVALVSEHRAVFERLRRMATEDMHKRSYFSESELGGIEPESRRAEYESLLRLKKGLRVTVDYDGSVRFIFATVGPSAIGPGWLKGIQFVPTGTKLKGALVKTLDTQQALPAGVYLVLVEPEWFLLYQVDE
jgi:hypothetical protein